MSVTDLQQELDRPYTLSEAQIRRFREDGFVKLKNVFSAELLEHYGRAITELTFEHNPLKGTQMADRSTYDKAFIQVGNLWEKDERAKAFSFAPRLARIATELLGTRGVRMYHDQALYKEPAGGFTPWHVDQQYWPFTSGLSVTAWIPLQAVPIEMGPLCFGKGSHVKNIGRDLAISDESERLIREAIKRDGLIEEQGPYELGEVSFHYGWTLHRAGPNTTDQPRKVHTVIYMDRDMRLAVPKNENQDNDRKNFAAETTPGDIIDGPRTPVLYSVD